ncbi:MAG: HD domain-containing protein [Lachnospiraceae bacterium]|nr:HD domain-containing protein [Lachnospiraceae bacterium]
MRIRDLRRDRSGKSGNDVKTGKAGSSIKTGKKRKDEGFNEQVRELAKDERIRRMKEFVQHGDISTYKHCLRVAKKSYGIAKKFPIRIKMHEMLKGAMLHDYFLYDWHSHGDKLHGYHHPAIALKNAGRDFDLTDTEKNIIHSHMWPLTLSAIPKCREAVIVCIADKLCSLEETLRKH